MATRSKYNYTQAQVDLIHTHLDNTIAGYQAMIDKYKSIPARERPDFVKRNMEHAKWAIAGLKMAKSNAVVTKGRKRAKTADKGTAEKRSSGKGRTRRSKNS